MNMSRHRCIRAPLLSALLLVLAAPLAAAETAPEAQGAPPVEPQTISPEAKAVLDHMVAFMGTMKTYSIESQSTRDEIVNFGYKVQHNEHQTLTVQLPNKLRAEISGDLRERTFVYDGAKLLMYSPEHAAYTRVDAPDTIGKLVDRLLAAGMEMPLVDMLYRRCAGRRLER